MTDLRIFISYLTFITIATGCLDPIDLDTGDASEILVIDGSLNLLEPVQRVTLTRSLPFRLKTFNPEQGALIFLLSDDGERPYTEISEGIYELNLDGYPLKSGSFYSLKVITRDGQEYVSIPDQMPYIQTVDSLSLRFERDVLTLSTGVEFIDDVLNVYLSTDINLNEDESVYFKWFYDELYLFTDQQCGPFDFSLTCYVPLSGDNQNFSLLSSDNLSSNRIDNILVATKRSLPLREFQNRHYFIIYQQAITKQAYDYWSKVIEVSRQRGTVFDRPPASVKGNFMNLEDSSLPVLGFFELTAVDTIRAFVVPSQFADARTREVACSPFNRRLWPIECCDCLNIPNASLERPPWVD